MINTKVLFLFWSCETTVRVWRQHEGHSEVEEEEIWPVYLVQILHHVALQLPHEVGDDVGRAAPLGGIPQHVELPVEVLGHPCEVQHPPHLSLCVHVDYEGEVSEAGGAVVGVETPVGILDIKRHSVIDWAGMAGLHRTTCPLTADIARTRSTWARPRPPSHTSQPSSPPTPPW